MRWKLAVWLSAALTTTVCAQMISIDKDIHLQDELIFESDTTIIASTTQVPSQDKQQILTHIDENNQVTVVDNPLLDSQQNSIENDDTVDVAEPEEGNENESGANGGDGNDDVQDSGDGQNSTENGQVENDSGQEEGHVSVEIGLESDENRVNSTETEDGDNQAPSSNENTPIGSIEQSQENQGSSSNENTPIGSIEQSQENQGSSSNENVPIGSIERSQENISNQGSVETPRPSSGESGAMVEIIPIEIETGYVQGFYLHGDLRIRSFIDIPYGMFSGLFKAPVKAEKWEGIHDVQQHQKKCPQVDEAGDYAGDIDCLTLSVFAPTNVENAAVLLHIYDGQLRTGSADPTIYGPEYLVTKGVILVLPNYRLGPLGFLCMHNETAPGNAALKDLTLALDWIKSNIEQFGGNPSKIVVSGDGHSGALAGYLALSPKSREYISGVISESGAVLAPWAIDRDPITTAIELGDILHEAITDEIEVESLVTHAKNIWFRPCIESIEAESDAFIPKPPWKIIEQWESGDPLSPFMIGSASHAGLHEAMQQTAESLSQLDEDFSRILPNDLSFENGEEDKTELSEKIRKQYFSNRSITLDEMNAISLCYTDAYYLGPAIRASRALVEAGAKVYFYEFSFVGDLNRELASLSTTVQGAARGDIVGYTFTQDGDMPYPGSDEEHLVDLITDLWVTFIQTGEPSAENVEWNDLQKSSELTEEWLSLDSETTSHHGVHVDRLTLWTEIYNNHFVDSNFSLQLGSSLSLVVATVMLLFCFNKKI